MTSRSRNLKRPLRNLVPRHIAEIELGLSSLSLLRRESRRPLERIGDMKSAQMRQGQLLEFGYGHQGASREHTRAHRERGRTPPYASMPATGLTPPSSESSPRTNDRGEKPRQLDPLRRGSPRRWAIEPRSGFPQAARRQIHDDAILGHGKPRRANGCANPLASLLHRDIGHSDDRHARKPARNDDLDDNGHRFDAADGRAENRALPLISSHRERVDMMPYERPVRRDDDDRYHIEPHRTSTISQRFR